MWERLDAIVLGPDGGENVDNFGMITIQENRLYKLIQAGEYGVHTIEIEILGIGLKAYTFTFG